MIIYPASVCLKAELQTVNTAGLKQPTLIDGVIKKQPRQQRKVSVTSQFDQRELTAPPCLSLSRPV